VKFLVDNQLPAALARFLTSLGSECQHVLDLELAQTSDRAIWRYAAANDLVIITKDEDFFNLATASPVARLIWVRSGNSRKRPLLESFKKLWPYVLDRLNAGDRIIELR